MMKFSALNESSLSDDDGDPELATREAQEEEAYSIYHSALRKQFQGDLEEAEEMFKDLLEEEFLTQAQPKEEKNSGPLGPALTLKYLVYKNLATISKEKNDWHASVSFYLEALEIDSADVMMWYHMGKASLNIANYSLARLCFEEGLKCNPNHWPCLDNVISVMYTLNDYANCLYYIAQALEKECYYLKGLAIKDAIYKEDPSLKSFCESFFKNCDSSIHFVEYDKEEANKMIQECLDMRERKRSLYKPKPFPVLGLGHPIKEYTWKNLGDSLINAYDCIANADPCVSFSCKIDLSPYLENKLSSESNSEKTSVQSPISSLSEPFSNNSVPPSNTVQQNGLDAPSSQDPTMSEMEIDEVNQENKANEVQSVLLLPQADVQLSDISVFTDSTSGSRRTKRKRSELAELSDFVSKRRSTRVRNPTIKRPQDNTNYQELLHKFLPAKLIGDGKFDEQDYDSDNFSQDKSNCGDHTYGQSTEREKKDSSDPSNPSNLCSTEKEEVCDFIAKNQSNGGIIDLLYKYVVILGAKSNLIWSKVMTDVYCSTFSRLRNHITIPNLYSHSTEAFRIKELGLAFLVYCEFKVDQWYQNTGNSTPFSLKMAANNSGFSSDKVGDDFHADMEFLVQLTSRYDVLGEEWLNFSARALWLKAKFHSLEGEIDLAVCCMGKLYSVLSDDEVKHMKITVHNCNVSNVIAAGNVKQQLESLQRCQSLEEVQRLYEHGDYAAVVDLLVLTFNQPRTSRKQSLDGVPERHAQLLLLQNSLMKLERYKDCVYWSEMAFNEALQQFMNATKNAEWSETMAELLSGLDKCAKIDSRYLAELEDSKLVRLTQNLVLIIVIQMENYDFAGDNAALLVILPWIILYRLILNEEKRNKGKHGSGSDKGYDIESLTNNKNISSTFLADFDLSASIPSSLMLLFTAHECLGRRSWCTACDGFLLLTFIDIMMAELQDSNSKAYLYREDLETGLEQCIYCLYGHPNKRSRAKHLQEHNTKQITLTWERAVLVFQYFKPNILPEFDSYRTSTISAELENLFRRISALVPPEEDPTSQVDGFTAYIEGGTDKCPDPPFKGKKHSEVVKDLYYLLGDFYFKNKEFGKAIRFYLCDICINPDRQDSWAGMALSRSSQLDQKLNSYELRNESTIYRKASAALRCFEHALELDPTTTSLWIEYGSLAYILHSHASRQLKQETFCDEIYDMLKKKKQEMLQVAKRCFRNANRCEDGGEPEEAWLHHYMLGKISEKEGKGPVVYLDHYRKALAYLHEDFARYPQKILYHNPAELSIEALEVYYRVHASCIKFLWKNESIGVDLATVKIVQECLHSVKKSPFYTFQEKSRSEIAGSSSNAASENEEVNPPFKDNDKLSDMDHNYSENTSINAKKISEDSRHSRPSTDSLPESQDLIVVKEIIDSLVSVIAERFVDEAKENDDLLSHISTTIKEVTKTDSKVDTSKVVIESFAEESVYTTKISPEQSSPVETDSIDQLISPMQVSMNSGEMDDLDKLRELAEEIVNLAAKSANKAVGSEKQIILEKSFIDQPTNDVNKDEVMKSLSLILNSVEVENNLKPAEQITEEMNDCSIAEVENKSSVNVSKHFNDDLMEVDTEAIPTVIENPLDSKQTLASESKIVQNTEDIVDNLKTDVSGVTKKSDIHEKVEVSTQELQDQEIENISLKEEIEAKDKANKKNSQDNAPASEKELSLVESPKSQAVLSQPSPEELKKSRADIGKLILKCLDAMRECLQRFPQHYKALYRIAHYYCHSTTSNKNLQWAREVLLAATPATKKYPSMSGLFAERKNTNFFNGIWRAPSNEIDRPGSFGAHMYRSVHLLIDVLVQQKDYNMLVNLTLQLHRTPDLGKKYMRDTDRVFLVRKAYDACVNILRDQMNTLLQEEPPPEESRLICCLLEIYRTWMTLIKASVNVDDSNELLEEAYTMYKLGEVDPHPSVLDQAKNFCQIQLGKTYPERSRRDFSMMDEHSLQPLYTVDSGKSGTTSKYIALPDISSSHLTTSSLPSASTYNPDAWQKGSMNQGLHGNHLTRELAESLMMPVLPCEGKIKPETKTVKTDSKPPQLSQETLVVPPVEVSFSAAPTPPMSQNSSSTAPQMVHVEKPKAENLQACSVAFLPVAPVFPKENINPPPVYQPPPPPPPLLSCQAFECFDVLTSIMQASGYQVAPQVGSMPQTFDPTNSYNFKTQGNIPNMLGYHNFPPKMSNIRLGRKRRRGRSPKMEGLNLSKKMHTKPIVSTTIANSIAQLKIDPVVTSDRRLQSEPTQSAPLCLVKPKPSKRVPCYKTNSAANTKGLDLSKKSSESVTSTQCSVIVPNSESLKFNLGLDYDKIKDRSRSKTVKSLKKEKKIVADMLPDIYDFTDDSNLSTNLETSRIEKCAKEMLEFMNQKVGDTGLNDKIMVDTSKNESKDISLNVSVTSNTSTLQKKVDDFELNDLDAKANPTLINLSNEDHKINYQEKKETCVMRIKKDDDGQNTHVSKNISAENNEINDFESINRSTKETSIQIDKIDDSEINYTFTKGSSIQNDKTHCDEINDQDLKGASIFINKIDDFHSNDQDAKDPSVENTFIVEIELKSQSANDKSILSNKKDDIKLDNLDTKEESIQNSKKDKVELNDQCAKNASIQNNKIGHIDLKSQGTTNSSIQHHNIDDVELNNEHRKDISIQNDKVDDAEHKSQFIKDISIKINKINDTALNNQFTKYTSIQNSKTENFQLNNENTKITCIRNNILEIVHLNKQDSNDTTTQNNIVDYMEINEDDTKNSCMQKNEVDEAELKNPDTNLSSNQDVKEIDNKSINEDSKYPSIQNNKIDNIEIKDGKKKDILLPMTKMNDIELNEQKTENSLILTNEVDDIRLKHQTLTDISVLKDEVDDPKSNDQVLLDISIRNIEVSDIRLNDQNTVDISILKNEIDDVGLSDMGTADIAIPKNEIDSILRLLEAENDSEKEFNAISHEVNDFLLENDAIKNCETGEMCEKNETENLSKSTVNDEEIKDQEEEPEMILPEITYPLAQDTTNNFSLLISKFGDIVPEDAKDMQFFSKNNINTKSEECLETFQKGESDVKDKYNKVVKKGVSAGGREEEKSNDTMQFNQSVNVENSDATKNDEMTKNSFKINKEDTGMGEDEKDEESTDEMIVLELHDTDSMDGLTDEDSYSKYEDCVQNKYDTDLINVAGKVDGNSSSETEISDRVKNTDDSSKKSENKVEEEVIKEEIIDQYHISCYQRMAKASSENNGDKNLKGESDSSYEVGTVNLKAEYIDSKGECSKSGADKSNAVQLDNNKTKNINYSILKKDCVVVIKLKSEDFNKSDYIYSKSEGAAENQDDDTD